MKPNSGQFRGELGGFKAVPARVLCEGAEGPRVKHVAGHLFEQQSSSRPHHPSNLCHCVAPAGNVMQDAEVNDGIEAAAGRLDGGRITRAERERARGAPAQSTSGAFHLLRVDIQGCYVSGAKPVKDDLNSDSATTANLQYALAG